MKRILLAIACFLFPILLVLGLNLFIFLSTRPLLLPREEVQAEVALVFGASVLPSGQPSDILADRLRTAEALYANDQVAMIVVSGDGVGDDGYDEVEAMRNYLLALDVPAADIVSEPWGLDSFQSIRRFRELYSDRSVVFVTQGYHLPRVLFIGRSLGLQVVGTAADLQTYIEIDQFRLREVFANIKAATEVLVLLMREGFSAKV